MNLLFITYVNRSGSTFLANLFSRYSNVIVCPEGEVLVKNFLYHPLSKSSIKIPELFRDNLKLNYWGLEVSQLEKIDTTLNNIDKFCEILNIYRSGTNSKASTIVFKAPELIDTYNKISQTTKEKYNIKYVSIIRDGRASFSSQKETYYLGKPLETNPYIAARKWNRHINLSNKYNNDKDFFLLKYEEFIHNTEGIMLKLINKIKMTIDQKNVLEEGSYFEVIPPTQKQMHLDITKNPDISKIDKWKKILPAQDIYVFEKVSKNTLEKSGYELLSPKVQFTRGLPLLTYYTFKGWVSILLYHLLRISSN